MSDESDAPQPHWGHDTRGRFQYVDYDEERLIIYPAQGGGLWVDKRGEGPVFVRQEDVVVVTSALESASLKPTNEPLKAQWTLSDTEFSRELGTAWESGMRHALAWLGLKQYGDVMAKDNPHGRAGE